jgi:phosphoribosylformimino-5-aminoimidazole carboxamide ribotide isomerase
MDRESDAMKVYPAMDLLDGRVVRLHKGDYDAVTVYSDDPIGTVRGFVDAGAERVHIVDLDGARAAKPAQADLVREVIVKTGARVQTGGGIRSMEQIEAYVASGVERVVLGTAAVKDPAFVAAACARFAIVVAVDARDGWVATEGWTEGSTVRATELAERARELGACAVLYTDIARDGTGAGPNVEATAALARAVPGLEVIASGGIGTLAHLRALAARPEIAACVVGRALYDGTLSVRDALDAARGEP